MVSKSMSDKGIIIKTNIPKQELVSPDLIIFGQATIDDIYREDEGLVSLCTPGGDSIYSILGATAWPIRAGIVCCVGNDYPRDLLSSATCNNENTDWSGLSFYPTPSIHLKATYYNDGRRTYVFDDDALLHYLSPGEQDIPRHMRDCKFVHIAPADCKKQLELVHYFSSRGALVTLDIETHFIKEDLDTLYEMLKYKPIFIPSLEHIQFLSGNKSKDPFDQWEWIKNCGVDFAVVKCGAEDTWVFDVPAKKLWLVGVVPNLNVVDVTGAGDSFCGGYLAGMILTKDPIRSAAYGSVSASFVVESLGATRPNNYNLALANSRLSDLLSSIATSAILLP